MWRTTLAAAPRRPDQATRRDAGATLIEVVIAIMLMGTVVAATMTMLTGTVTATRLNRDHSNAHAWLQTASDMLYARELERCSGDALAPPMSVQRAAIMADYQQTVRETQNPEGWASSNIEVISLDFWHFQKAADHSVEESWATDRCTTDLQRVGLRVREPNGEIVEEVEVVIGGD